MMSGKQPRRCSARPSARPATPAPTTSIRNCPRFKGRLPFAVPSSETSGPSGAIRFWLGHPQSPNISTLEALLARTFLEQLEHDGRLVRRSTCTPRRAAGILRAPLPAATSGNFMPESTPARPSLRSPPTSVWGVRPVIFLRNLVPGILRRFRSAHGFLPFCCACSRPRPDNRDWCGAMRIPRRLLRHYRTAREKRLAA